MPDGFREFLRQRTRVAKPTTATPPVVPGRQREFQVLMEDVVKPAVSGLTSSQTTQRRESQWQRASAEQRVASGLHPSISPGQQFVTSLEKGIKDVALASRTDGQFIKSVREAMQKDPVAWQKFRETSPAWKKLTDETKTTFTSLFGELDWQRTQQRVKERIMLGTTTEEWERLRGRRITQEDLREAATSKEWQEFTNKSPTEQIKTVTWGVLEKAVHPAYQATLGRVEQMFRSVAEARQEGKLEEKGLIKSGVFTAMAKGFAPELFGKQLPAFERPDTAHIPISEFKEWQDVILTEEDRKWEQLSPEQRRAEGYASNVKPSELPQARDSAAIQGFGLTLMSDPWIGSAVVKATGKSILQLWRVFKATKAFGMGKQFSKAIETWQKLEAKLPGIKGRLFPGEAGMAKLPPKPKPTKAIQKELAATKRAVTRKAEVRLSAQELSKRTKSLAVELKAEDKVSGMIETIKTEGKIKPSPGLLEEYKDIHPALKSKTGLSGDEMAERLGFASEDAMVQELKTIRKLPQVSDFHVQAREMLLSEFTKPPVTRPPITEAGVTKRAVVSHIRTQIKAGEGLDDIANSIKVTAGITEADKTKLLKEIVSAKRIKQALDARKIVKREFRADKINLPEEQKADILERFEAMGLGKRTVETFGDWEKLAQELGYADIEKLLKGTARPLSKVETIALRNTINNNKRAIIALEKMAITNPAMKAEITVSINKATVQMEAAIGRLAEGLTETGRALSSARIIAQDTLDPAFWFARARRTAGAQRFTAKVQNNIMELIAKKDPQKLAEYMVSLKKPTPKPIRLIGREARAAERKRIAERPPIITEPRPVEPIPERIVSGIPRPFIPGTTPGKGHLIVPISKGGAWKPVPFKRMRWLQKHNKRMDRAIQMMTREGASVRTVAEGRLAFQSVMNNLKAGQIEPSAVLPVMRTYRMTSRDIAEMYMQHYVLHTDSMRKLGKATKEFTKIFGREEGDKLVSALAPRGRSAYGLTMQAYRKADNVRRSIMVSQLATAMRNMLSQTGRYSLNALEDAMQGTMRLVFKGESAGRAYGAFMEDFAAIARRLSSEKRKRLLEILDAFPKEGHRLFTAPMHDVIMTKVNKVINAANWAQEKTFRMIALDAKLTDSLNRIGIDISRIRPGAIPESAIKEAVNHALEVTFAARPEGKLGNLVLQTYEQVPVLTALVNPYPRFWMNSLKFLYEYSPAGFTKLFNPSFRKLLTSTNPAVAYKALSRASLGTSMLGSALAIRHSDFAGEKWYELKVGTRPDGTARYVDMRPFAPFSTYLFLAEVMRSIAGEQTSLTGRDWAEAAISINRIQASGLVIVDIIRSDTTEVFKESAKQILGSWMGGFSVNFKTFSDFIAHYDEEEAKARTTRESPILGPFMTNIPYLRQLLPTISYPAKPGEIITEAPVTKQLTGLRFYGKTPLEQELDRLAMFHIYPRTPDREINRLTVNEMGKLAEVAGNALINRKEYQEAPPVLQKKLLSEIFTSVKAEAQMSALTKLEQQGVTKQEMFERLRPKQAELIKAINEVYERRQTVKPGFREYLRQRTRQQNK